MTPRGGAHRPTAPGPATALPVPHAALLDRVPVMVAFFSADGLHCLYANASYAQAFGFEPHAVIGRSAHEVLGAEALSEVLPHVERLQRLRTPVRYERLQAQAGERPRHYEVQLLPHWGPDDALAGIEVVIHDLTHQRRAQAARMASDARMRKFLRASVEGVVFHHDGRIVDVNPPLCQLMGSRLQALQGRELTSLFVASEQARVAQALEASHELRLESQLCTDRGQVLPVELLLRTLPATDESAFHRLLIIRDLRERHASIARMQFLAHHDGLTQLLNRTTFIERVNERLQSSGAASQLHALLFIDLDNFKRVNDSLGHLEGDKVLAHVAERLQGALRANDLIGRFGGDEFLVLLSDLHSEADVRRVLASLQQVVEVPVQAGGRELSVTPSIGVALAPAHGLSAETLIQHADAAMSLAKAAGRGTSRFFAPELAEQAYAQLVIESELSQALTRREFVLFYQPQVDARTGALRGAEALLRWQHPTRGLLTPDAFIEVAERHRLILPLSEWVMREAARQSRDWHQRGLSQGPISINLSSMQFQLEDFDRVVETVLKEEGIPGRWLELELTERMLIHDPAHVPALLQKLRALGVGLAVDDFGTGYTSLAHLGRLPLDKLKIDQSFVAALPGDASALAITRAMVQMGLGLGLELCAEGVRQPAQASLLADWGCHSLQGQLIAAPMSGADFETWQRQRQVR